MKRIFFLAFMLTGFISFSQVAYIAHRGASYLAPENTVASANLAWELDADAVEIDIYLTKDNRVMVCHDRSTKRTAGVDLKISETNSDELRKLDVGSWKDARFAGEKIPYIEEILETVPAGKKLVVEIKCGSEVLAALKKAIDESGKLEQIIFIGFGWETIIDTKKTFPGNACYWLSSVEEDVLKRLGQVAEFGLDGLNLSYKIIHPDLARQVNESGIDLLTWTVDDPEEAKRLVGLGVKAITTNRPGWLREQIQ